MKLLNHFIICSFATTLNLSNVCEGLNLTRGLVGQQFWAMLPNLGTRESMVSYIQKLEVLIDETNDQPEQILTQISKLNIEGFAPNGSPIKTLGTLLEENYESL